MNLLTFKIEINLEPITLSLLNLNLLNNWRFKIFFTVKEAIMAYIKWKEREQQHKIIFLTKIIKSFF